jgi:hypothetical protein
MFYTIYKITNKINNKFYIGIAYLLSAMGLTDKVYGTKMAMIPKRDLEHDTWYIGTCRNSSEAKWNANIQKFLYLRCKFNESFWEEIEHPEDSRGYDVFKPSSKKIMDR